MTFKDIKQGNTVFILHKEDHIKAGTGKVTQAAQPRLPNMQNGIYNPSITQQMVMDISIEDNGSSKIFTIPANLEVTYAGASMVISTTREGILREVESIKNAAEEKLSNMERYKSESSECEQILTEWNPAFREKRETEARFGSLENDMRDMKSLLKSLVEKLS